MSGQSAGWLQCYLRDPVWNPLSFPASARLLSAGLWEKVPFKLQLCCFILGKDSMTSCLPGREEVFSSAHTCASRPLTPQSLCHLLASTCVDQEAHHNHRIYAFVKQENRCWEDWGFMSLSFIHVVICLTLGLLSAHKFPRDTVLSSGVNSSTFKTPFIFHSP